VYEGPSIIEAGEVYNYAKVFFATSEPMPVPGYIVKLSISSIETEFDLDSRTHKVILYGVFI
jgi:hypothetical protein